MCKLPPPLTQDTSQIRPHNETTSTQPNPHNEATSTQPRALTTQSMLSTHLGLTTPAWPLTTQSIPPII